MLRKIQKLFAVVLSLAIITMSMFTGVVVSAADPIVSEYTAEAPEVSLLDPTQPNSESNPYIIESANQMYSLMIGNSTNGGEKIDTAGKFFKVADGIKAFYMNGGATVAAMTTPAQVKEYFEVTNTGAKKVWSDKTKAFKGTFDGNGVTIYGIRSDGSYAGLFPYVDGDATIKNVTVKNSYLVGSAAGGIVGTVNGSAAPNSITVENVQVINNYISGSRGDCGAGGLFGFLYSSKATDGYPEIHVNNCIVAGNELISVNASAPGAFSFAGSFGGNRQHKIKNSIFLGGDHMFNVTSHWAKQPGFYENVYTDADLSLTGQNYTDSQLVQVTTTTGTGVKEAMPNLDWNKTWAANAGLPVLRVFHNIVIVDNEDGTHSESCVDCSLVCSTSDHVYTEGECICGAIDPTYDPYASEYTHEEPEISLLDPTQPNSESNPYIIENANQMYSLMIANSTNGGEKIDTDGKYFKVADGMKSFYMNGGATVAAMTTPEQVKEYFTVTNTGAKKVWSDKTKAFKGTFDGNGVTIYGIRSDDANAGLFPFVDGDATIKNVTVKNSYLVGATAGGLVGTVNGSAAPNSITAENCQVINNYISGNRPDCGAGGLFGFLYSANATDGYPETHVNNCIVAGNELISVNAAAPGAFSFAGSFGGNRQHKIKNSIFLGGDHMFNTAPWWAKQPGFYENVYTNADLSLTGQNYTENQLVQVTTTTGEGVKAAMPNLDWNKTWAANNGMPVLRMFHNIVDGTCERCGLAVFEDPCAKGHTLTSVEEVPATKTETGTKAHDKCEVCNRLFINGVEVTAEDVVIPMIVSYVRWQINTYDDDFIAHADQPGDGSKDNPYIIFDAEDLASVVVGRVVNVFGADKDTATPIDTTGVYFKVADGIEGFYMANDDPTYGSPDKWDTMEKVKAALSDKAGVYKWWKMNTFKGHFDGNGATVYGLYADKEDAALFPMVGAGSEIKNIAVKNSYFKAANNAGAIAGQVQWYASIGDSSHTFESCISQNNYIEGTEAGAIIGHGRENKLIINNCLAIGNDFAGEKYLVGTSWCDSNTISNTVVIDGLVYGKGNQLKKSDIFTNVFTNTDQSGSGIAYTPEQVTVLADDAMTAENMSHLDLANTWICATYPELRVFHNFVVVNNGDGTHSESCECGLTTAAQEHTYENGECNVCGNKCLHSNVGEAQIENYVDATCVSTGSYDSVTYCVDCGMEISRVTNEIDIDPDAHAFDNAADKDCNNGCGLVRVNYGDSDGDGEINNKDIAVIMQHINGWDTEIDETAADVNLDGKINNKDYALLMQFVNGWDVFIG